MPSMIEVEEAAPVSLSPSNVEVSGSIPLRSTPLSCKPGSMKAHGGNAAVPGRLAGTLPATVPGDERNQDFRAIFADRLCRPISSAITFRPICVMHRLIDQAKPRTRRCSAHDTGKSRIRFSRLAVSSMGWRPARIASTMSGARRPSGRIRLTTPRKTP